MTDQTRDEHLAWCKQRALEYLDRGDVLNAMTSMLSDLSKHQETKLSNPYLTMMAMFIARDHDIEGAQRFIEGFR
jgi:hypothetical protein